MSEEHRRLVAATFPGLDPIRSFEPIEGGWACHTYLVNDAWIVQLPRTNEAAERLRRQIAVLPELAAELSAPIPVPELVAPEVPAMAYRRIDGRPAASGDGIWPERLGRLLTDLHLTPPEYVGLRARSAEDVRDDVRATWGRLRGAVAPLLTADELGRADDLVGRALDDDEHWRFAPCLTHRDLGPEHVLVTPTGDLAGVIDWEEVAVADPADDFAWWLHARPDEGERALAAYGGPPDGRFRDRTRVAFALMPWYEVVHGLGDGGDAFVASGLRGVRERLALVAS